LVSRAYNLWRLSFQEEKMTEKLDEVWVPEILRVGTRGVRAKIWAFLYVNEGKWFSAKQIASYLDMPMSTVQVSLKDLLPNAPRVISMDREKCGRGRPEKIYSFQRFIQSTK